MDAYSDCTALLFPTEILEKCIFEAWISLLSTDHRITFMTSSLLVSRIWRSLFIRISFTDVHIPCQSYLDHYRYAITRRLPSIFNEQGEGLPRTLCRSITVKVRNSDVNAGSGDERDMYTGKPPTSCLPLTLGLLKDYYPVVKVPNLHTLCIKYENMRFDHIFEWHPLTNCPPHVTNLEFSFSFDERMAALGDAYRKENVRQDARTVACHRRSLSGIRSLTFAGATDAFVEDMVACCPNVKSITTSPAPVATV